MSRQQPARLFDARKSFEFGLEEIARLSNNSHKRSQCDNDRYAYVDFERPRCRERGQHRREKSADCALPCLSPADSWRERPLSDRLSNEEGACVSRKGDDQQEHDPLKPLVDPSQQRSMCQ